MYMMGYYSATQRKEIVQFPGTRIDLETHTERVKSEREKQISYDIILEKEMESGKMEQKNVFAKHK